MAPAMTRTTPPFVFTDLIGVSGWMETACGAGFLKTSEPACTDLYACLVQAERTSKTQKMALAHDLLANKLSERPLSSS